MSERVSKNGNRVTVTEYEVREINIDGDAINVDHHDTKSAALKQADAYHFAPGGVVVAVVVEKHVSKYPHHGEPDQFTTLYSNGSRDALVAGGWLEGVE